jgi:tRNA G18 (ribose-2'-O)-methylase SpoU
VLDATRRGGDAGAGEQPHEPRRDPAPAAIRSTAAARGWRWARATGSRALDELALGGAGDGGVDRRDERLALLFGAEGPGLSPGTLAAADVCAGIPMRGGVDSLNVGVAAGIAFWVLGRAGRHRD